MAAFGVRGSIITDIVISVANSRNTVVGDVANVDINAINEVITGVSSKFATGCVTGVAIGSANEVFCVVNVAFGVVNGFVVGTGCFTGFAIGNNSVSGFAIDGANEVVIGVRNTNSQAVVTAVVFSSVKEIINGVSGSIYGNGTIAGVPISKDSVGFNSVRSFHIISSVKDYICEGNVDSVRNGSGGSGGGDGGFGSGSGSGGSGDGSGGGDTGVVAAVVTAAVVVVMVVVTVLVVVVKETVSGSE